VKKFIKALAVILSFLLLIQIAPMEALAKRAPSPPKHTLKMSKAVPIKSTGNGPETAQLTLEEALAAAPDGAAKNDNDTTPISGEVEELRRENTKIYRHIDGTFTAGVYWGPIHYRDGEGKWQDIDNRLLLGSDNAYAPAASGLDIRFPLDFADNRKLIVSKDGYTVGMGVKAQADAAPPEEEASDSEEESFVTEETTTVQTQPETTAAESTTTVYTETQTEVTTTGNTNAPFTAEADDENDPSATGETSTTEINSENSSQAIETTTVQETSEESTSPAETTTIRETYTETAASTTETTTTETTTTPENQAARKTIDLASVKAEVNNDIGAETKRQDENPNQTRTEKIEAENAKKMELDNLSSSVTYRDIFPGADLEYRLTFDEIKEYITVKELQEEYIYQFNLFWDGLFAVPQQDGSIYLLKNIEDAVPLFILEAPYMYDAAGAVSTALKMDLAADGTLTLTADAAWINDEARVFPVVIDPTLKDGFYLNNSDAYVSSASAGTNYSAGNYTYAGNGMRTYLKFALPTLPAGSVVAGAYFAISQSACTGAANGSNHLYVYDCTGKASWAANTITWTYQPITNTINGAYGTNVLDFKEIDKVGADDYIFDITKAVKNWYENNNNNGLMLTTRDEALNTRATLLSSRYNDPSKPSVLIVYNSNVGLEGYWSYETYGLGRSGTAYVNDYNGSLAYVHSDLRMNGYRLPINIAHVINTNCDDASGTYLSMKLGAGFRLNLLEQFIQIPAGPMYDAGYRYRYIDGDGTAHLFRLNSSNVITHEYDETQMLTGSPAALVLTDAQGNIKRYNTNGFLYQIVDRNGNTQTITWSGNQITQVTDPVGRKATFTYGAYGYLSKITDPSGRNTQFAYSGDNLTSITYPDGKVTAFQYSGGKLSRITADNNSYLTFAYVSTAGCGDRVQLVKKYDKAGAFIAADKYVYTTTNAAGQSTGNTLVYYTWDELTGTARKCNVYYFDRFGRMTSVTNQDGQTRFGEYHSATDSEEDRNRFNKIRENSELQTIAGNLLQNHGFEYKDGNGNVLAWEQLSDGSGAADGSDDEKWRGEWSMQLLTEDDISMICVSQPFDGVPGQAYTLSADIYIPEALEGTGGVYFGYAYEEGFWNQVTQVTAQPVITSTSGWERQFFTFTVPQGAGDCYVMLKLQDAEGTVYFDNVQLEASGGARYYNLVENSDFADADGREASYWTPSPALNPVNEGIFFDFGRNWYLRQGSPGVEKKISQYVPVNAQAGETLVIGGQAAAFPVTRGPDYDSFAIIAELYNSEEDLNPISVPVVFDQTVSHYHQMMATSYTLEEPCHHIVYSFIYYDQANTVCFDNAFVYVGNYGNVYKYKDDGFVEEVSSDKGDAVALEYDEVTKDAVIVEQEHFGIVTGRTEYTYDNKHNITGSTDRTGVETEYVYNSYGQVTKKAITKGELTTTETMTYTYDGNYMSSYTDARGKKTIYSYDTSKGLLNSVTDPNGNTITYTYDNLTDELVSTSGKADYYDYYSPSITTAVTTQDHMLKNITRNGTTYSYDYDAQNRVTAAKVGSQALVENTYDAFQRLESQTFANGAVYEPIYDNRDRLIGDKWDNVQTAEYFYNENDRLSQVVDNTTGVTHRHGYDFAGLLNSISGSDGTQTNLTYDIKDSLSGLQFSLNGDILHDAWYSSDNQGRPTGASLFSLDGAGLEYEYDEMGRLTWRSLSTGGTSLGTTFTYLEGANGNETDVVERYRNTDANAGVLQRWDYTYDNNGNVTGIKDFAGKTTTYTYDGLNRLTEESSGKTTLGYGYDDGGNLTSVTQNGSPLHSYTYGNANWTDQLTAFDNKTITYDDLGNPLTYDGRTFSWQKGRQLAGITGGPQNIAYTYDAFGNRIGKTVGSVTTDYLYSGNTLMRQSDGTDTLDFAYDAGGKAVGFTYNGVPYYYLRNLQGDVVAIADAEGTLVAEYVYDAWGNATILEMPEAEPEDPDVDGPRALETWWLEYTLENLGLSSMEIEAMLPEILAMDIPDMEGLRDPIMQLLPLHGLANFVIQQMQNLRLNKMDKAWRYDAANAIVRLGPEDLDAAIGIPGGLNLNLSGPISLDTLGDLIGGIDLGDLSDPFVILHYLLALYWNGLFDELRENAAVAFSLNLEDPGVLETVNTILTEICYCYLRHHESIQREWTRQNAVHVQEPALIYQALLDAGLSQQDADAVSALVLGKELWNAENLRPFGEAFDYNAQWVELMMIFMPLVGLIVDLADQLDLAELLDLGDVELIPMLANILVNTSLQDFIELLVVPEGDGTLIGGIIAAIIGIIIQIVRVPVFYCASNCEELRVELAELGGLDLGNPGDLAAVNAGLEVIWLCYFENYNEIKQEWLGWYAPAPEPEEEYSDPVRAYDTALAELNPIRYRGYYYDAETGYYFLQTRYYSPEWRRFINADSTFVAGDDALNASNMYAYCNGNPVMYADPSGMRARPILDAVKKVFPSTAPAVDALAGFLDKAEAGFDAFLGKATTFLETATEKLEKAVEVGQQLWTVVSPFVELAYHLNNFALHVASLTFNYGIPIVAMGAGIVAGLVRGVSNVIGAVFPAAMPVTAPLSAICTTVIQAAAFIIPASQFVGQLFDWGIMANDLFGALFGFGSYNVYGDIAIVAEPDMFPDYEYGDEYDSPGTVSEYEGVVKPAQVNLPQRGRAMLHYKSYSGATTPVGWETSHKDLKIIGMGNTVAEIIAEKGPRMVKAYATINGKKASNEVDVPIFTGIPNGTYIVAKSSGKYAYMKPGDNTDRISLSTTQTCRILGEMSYVSVSQLNINYYYVRLPNGNNRFVKQSDMKEAWPTNPVPGADLEDFLAKNGLTISTPPNSRIDVVVSGNNITLTTSFNITGALRDQRYGNNNSNPTYETLFIEGITQQWAGNYTVLGFSVILRTVIDSRSNKINVKMNDSAGRSTGSIGPITTRSGTITLYKAFTGGSVRTADEFRRVSAHEFGHIIGVDDYYPLRTLGDKLYDPNAPANHPSVMNFSSTNDVHHSDVEKFIKAYALGILQGWGPADYTWII